MRFIIYYDLETTNFSIFNFLTEIMDCYHCDSNAVKLKCSHCDSNIFRFCSQECGIQAHEDHKVHCYDRDSVEQLKTQLYLAIDEMQDEQDINDALDVADELVTHRDQAAKQEAHEIIQAHVEDQGFVRIESLQEIGLTATEKAQRQARRAAAREKRAKRRQTYLDKAELNRLKKTDDATTRAEQKAGRRRRLAQKARERAARYETSADKALQRGERAKARGQKPGLRERWNKWRQQGDLKRAEKYKSQARTNLDKSDATMNSSDDESSGSSN